MRRRLYFLGLVFRAGCSSPIGLGALALAVGLIIGEILRYTVGTP